MKKWDMNFKCKKISINDDPEFGCTIEFSDTENKNDKNSKIEDLLNPKHKYLLIQRSYPEDEDEIDWYSVESSESESELNEQDSIYVKLNQDSFEISWSGENLKIGLELPRNEFNELEKLLKVRFNERMIFLK